MPGNDRETEVGRFRNSDGCREITGREKFNYAGSRQFNISKRMKQG